MNKNSRGLHSVKQSGSLRSKKSWQKVFWQRFGMPTAVVLLGVIVGAALTFCSTVYQIHRERTSLFEEERISRVQHIHELSAEVEATRCVATSALLLEAVNTALIELGRKHSVEDASASSLPLLEAFETYWVNVAKLRGLLNTNRYYFKSSDVQEASDKLSAFLISPNYFPINIDYDEVKRDVGVLLKYSNLEQNHAELLEVVKNLSQDYAERCDDQEFSDLLDTLTKGMYSEIGFPNRKSAPDD